MSAARKKKQVISKANSLIRLLPQAEIIASTPDRDLSEDQNSRIHPLLKQAMRLVTQHGIEQAQIIALERLDRAQMICDFCGESHGTFIVGEKRQCAICFICPGK